MSLSQDNIFASIHQTTPTMVRVALAATSAHTWLEFSRFCAFLDVLDRKSDRKFLDIAIKLCQTVVFEKIKSDAEQYMLHREQSA